MLTAYITPVLNLVHDVKKLLSESFESRMRANGSLPSYFRSKLSHWQTDLRIYAGKPRKEIAKGFRPIEQPCVTQSFSTGGLRIHRGVTVQSSQRHPE